MPTVIIDHDVYKRIKQAAHRRHQQADELTNQALEDYLDRLEWVYSRIGVLPVLIKQVTGEPEPDIQVRMVEIQA